MITSTMLAHRSDVITDSGRWREKAAQRRTLARKKARERSSAKRARLNQAARKSAMEATAMTEKVANRTIVL